MRSRSCLLSVLLILAFGAAPAWAQDAGADLEPDFVVADEDTVVVAYPLLNDTDVAGGGLQLVAVGSTPAGDVRIDGTAVVFTPAANWTGETTVAYTARSENGEASGAIVITVVPINDPPTPADDTVTTEAGSPVAINVLANDTDVDGDELRLGTINAPANGTVTLDGELVVYRPAGGFSGTDRFSYRVFDGAGASGEATVDVAVTVAPTAPTVGTPVPTTVAAAAVPGPQWTAPPPPGAVGAGDSAGFVAALTRNLSTLYLPLVLLGLIGVAAWLVSQRGRDSRRDYAVVLVARNSTLPVHEKPAADSPVIHHLEYCARQVDVVGRRRMVGEVPWFPIATAGGRGWVDSRFLTEDVARATFEADLGEQDLFGELRNRLGQGATVVTSPRGVIDPDRFERDPARRRLGSNATGRLAALVADWRATFHVDTTASPSALRPPQLRNLHWISIEAPDLDPWQLFFEYHEGRPYPVAAIPENVAVPV